MPFTTRRITHRLTIQAPGGLIFGMLRDSSHWPYLNGLTAYSERVSGDDRDHELRTSVVTNGSLRSSHPRRVFDDSELRAEFHQLGLESPLLRLGGGWTVRRAAGFSEVTLEHEFELDEQAGDLPQLIHRTIDEYGRRELDALRLSCERFALLLEHHSAPGKSAPADAGFSSGASPNARKAEFHGR